MYTIIHHDTDETIELVRDVRHAHPAWVHAQCGTASEADLQSMIDQLWVGPYMDGRLDECGIGVRCLRITAAGGITFRATLIDGAKSDFLGSMEFGSIDDDGQYEQDDDEIIAEAREQFGVDASVEARVW